MKFETKVKEVLKHIWAKTNTVLLVPLLVTIIYSYQVINDRELLTPQRVIEWDVISYYDYLPATFILHDLKTMRTTPEIGGTYWGQPLPNGNKVLKTTMGMSMLYLPFFATAHLVAEPLGYHPNGFTEPYSWALVFSAIFYLFWGFYFLSKLLRKIGFGKVVTSAVILIIGLFTNLFWYATYSAPYSHSYSFVLISVFVYLTVLWFESPNVHLSVLAGLVFGLITLIRPSNGLVVLIPLLYGLKKRADVRERAALLLRSRRLLLIAVFCVIIVWMPQFIYWKSVTGNWTFYSYGDEGFFFNDPKLFQVMLGWRKGWLIYTPVMVFAVLGIFLVPRRCPDFAWAVPVFFCVNLFVVSSWWCWWYGGSCGMRPFIDSYGVMAIPLAVFLQWLKQNRHVAVKIPVALLIIWLSFRSACNNYRYYKGTIHWDGMTKQAYFDSYWGKSTEKFPGFIDSPDYEAAKKGIR